MEIKSAGKIARSTSSIQIRLIVKIVPSTVLYALELTESAPIVSQATLRIKMTSVGRTALAISSIQIRVAAKIALFTVQCAQGLKEFVQVVSRGTPLTLRTIAGRIARIINSILTKATAKTVLYTVQSVRDPLESVKSVLKHISWKGRKNVGNSVPRPKCIGKINRFVRTAQISVWSAMTSQGGVGHVKKGSSFNQNYHLSVRESARRESIGERIILVQNV